ncbi:unnamed protein product [Penicillium discolor]
MNRNRQNLTHWRASVTRVMRQRLEALQYSRYGFFDLDATFSAAFIHLMVGFLNTSEEHPESIDQAFEVLRFLSRSGNPAAEQRFQDITQSCLHIWPNYKFDINASDQAAAEIDAGTLDHSRYQGGTSFQSGSPTPQGNFPQYMAPLADGDQGFHTGGESWYPEPGTYPNPADTVFDMQGDLTIDLADEAEVIFSSFHNPTLPLTGVDYMDWLEIEKVLNPAFF